ncbi:MBL fold metallo-hydrolase [Pedobacter nototheniae]|uniref:MBL fold metallo-hydrolase n=1 Tax=Pedobacter nototheniae TaxID=2488994 RepID=UPI0010395E0F|nr:MBL fold metallo-hydrolase [Pedobacter nototheniae]
MKIEQFEDKHLSHYSYAVLSECRNEIILIDPSRDPSAYYHFAEEHQAKIVGVIETHPHADFVSAHLEIHNKTGATIYCSKLNTPSYLFSPFDEDQMITLGKITLRAINTPGHSPDSISILLEHEGKQKALFSGDTLFIGDCGRPDLRESGGDAQAERNFLASQMYHSLRDKLMKLSDEVILYPAHGAGTLCGKALSEANSSTIGAEKRSNWSLQEMTEADFVSALNENQPFIPFYFPFDVALNKKGAAPFEDSVSLVQIMESGENLKPNALIIDTRREDVFKKGHIEGAVNIMDGNKFETWLGSIVKPEEPYYLMAENLATLHRLIARTASIGYEMQLAGGFINAVETVRDEVIDIQNFKENQNGYTIVDVRNKTERMENSIFENSINIPLGNLRERVNEIPLEQPIAVHCAGGYRSAAASSLIASVIDGKQKVLDIGEAIKDFQN